MTTSNRSLLSSLASSVFLVGVGFLAAQYLINNRHDNDDDNDKNNTTSMNYDDDDDVMNNRDAKIIERIIQKRRSIFPKDYDTNKIVSKKIIDAMLHCAMYAPTHGRTKPWRFIIFTGMNELLKLGEFEAELYSKITNKEDFKQSKYEKKISNKINSSYVIAICMKRQISQKIPEIEEIEAIACAVQNMHLVATAYNVGAYWSSGNLIYTNEYKQFLGLTDENDKVLGMFHVGYSVKAWPKSDENRFMDVNDKVTWEC